MKCENLYDEIFNGESQNGYDLFELAACFLGGLDPEKLRAMLKSDDLGIVSDGLFVAGEIGSLASNYVDEFRALATSDDGDISMRASDLLGVYDQSETANESGRAR